MYNLTCNRCKKIDSPFCLLLICDTCFMYVCDDCCFVNTCYDCYKDDYDIDLNINIDLSFHEAELDIKEEDI